MTVLSVPGAIIEKTTVSDTTYRFDFALIVLTGNITRYLILRPLVETDSSVQARWFPIRTWFDGDPLAFLPGALRLRLRHFLDSRRLFAPSRSDAVLIHAFETYYLYTLFQRLWRRDLVIVKNPDSHLTLPSGSRWRDMVANRAIAGTDAFVFWANDHAERSQAMYPALDGKPVHVLHPGIPLDKWNLRPPREPGERFQLLFIGGDLLRKGADTLLVAYEKYLADTCDLHIATQSHFLPLTLRETIERLANVHLHLDLKSGSEPLQNLYRTADAFVLPTNLDSSSWVAIEALATGLPVIICAQGGIPDIVRHEQTGLIIPPKDPEAIADAVNRLRTSPELRATLRDQGRAHIEANYDARKNTQVLLDLMKSLTDARRNR